MKQAAAILTEFGVAFVHGLQGEDPKHYKTAAMGAFVMLVVSAAVGFLLWYTLVREAHEIQPLVPALKSWWMKLHVPANFIGYGTFALSAMVAFAYLIKQQATETKWYKLAPLWLLGVVLCFEPIVFRKGATENGGSYWMVYFGISALIAHADLIQKGNELILEWSYAPNIKHELLDPQRTALPELFAQRRVTGGGGISRQCTKGPHQGFFDEHRGGMTGFANAQADGSVRRIGLHILKQAAQALEGIGLQP